MKNPEWVYLNGRFVPYAEAVVPVEDRGNLFADGIYEVIRFYHGKPFALKEHMERLAASARSLELPLPASLEEIERVVLESIRRENLTDATVYLQISRGAAPRTHAFPTGVRPTWFVIVRPAERPDAGTIERGAAAITTPDLRWHRCDVKSISLLPNALAKEQARRRGAVEAILIRDGWVTEGSSSNCFVVLDGQLRTHPRGPHILGGITREVVLRLAQKAGLEVLQTAVRAEELLVADEVFLSGTTTEVLPIVKIDGHNIGEGRPGPISRQLQAAFDELITSLQTP